MAILKEVLQPGFREEPCRVLAKLPVLTQVVDNLGISHVCKRVIILTYISESSVSIIPLYFEMLLTNNLAYFAQGFRQLFDVFTFRYRAWQIFGRFKIHIIGHYVRISKPLMGQEPLVDYYSKHCLVAFAIKEIRTCHIPCKIAIRTLGIPGLLCNFMLRTSLIVENFSRQSFHVFPNTCTNQCHSRLKNISGKSDGSL